MEGHYYVLFFLLAVFSVVVILVKRVYWHPLSKFPGPILPATTSFYQFYILRAGKEGPWYRSLHEKYGPVVRCGPNHLSFNDPEMVPIVYHRKVNKTNFHQEFSCPAAVFNQKDHVDHAAAKRRFGHAFSFNRVKLLEGVLDEQITKWMSVLQDQAEQDPIVQWETWARYFSFDAITAVGFGEPTGFLDAKSDVGGLIENMDKAMYLQTLSLYPKIAWFARKTAIGRWIFVSRRTDKDGLGPMMAEIHRITHKRIISIANEEKPLCNNSMLDQWLFARNSNSEAIPVEDIKDQLLMDMLAGPDSISLMTTNLTFLMAAHPMVLKRAQAEIDEAFRNHSFLSSSPSFDECRRLPFVDACVREGLRIVASTFPRRRCSPPDVPFYLGGEFVPAGTLVASSACLIGRHKELYGNDADDFFPDRWLRASEDQLRVWETLDVHWGFGVRKCLGKHIGLMILYKSLVLLLRGFDLELEDTTDISLWSYPSSDSIRMLPRSVKDST